MFEAMRPASKQSRGVDTAIRVADPRWKTDWRSLRRRAADRERYLPARRRVGPDVDILRSLGLEQEVAEPPAGGETAARQRLRRFICGRGVAEPNADLRPGRWVRIEGLGALFSGEFYVVEITHVFDGIRGLRTEFAVERAGLGGGQQ